MSNADDDEKAQFFFVRKRLPRWRIKVDTDKNLAAAAAAYLNLVDAEKTSGKTKYTSDAAKSIMK
jgi:hypothetical protein